MEFNKVNQERHSIRDFSSRQVSTKQLQTIVKAAQQAPSWVNSQPWKVYIATGNTLEQIKKMSQQQDASHVAGSADLDAMSRIEWAPRTQTNMQEWGKQLASFFKDYTELNHTVNELTYHLNYAPAIAYITIPQQSPEWSVFDAGAFAQTLMLAAKNLGIDSVPTYNSVRFPNQLRRIMNIPETEKIIIGIELGYAKDSKINHFQAKRQPLEEILEIKD